MRKLIPFSLLALGLLVTPALAVDYDSDGRDDLESIEVRRPRAGVNKGDTRWSIRLSKSGKVVVHKFSIPGDAFFHYKRSDGKTYPGIVWVKDSNLPLYWFIKGPKKESRLTFGLPGDTIPNQTDFDGDGVTDLTTVRTRGDNSLEWFARMSKSKNAVQSTVFGSSGEKVGVGPGAMMYAVNSNLQWKGKVFGEETTSFSETWGQPGDVPLFGNATKRIAVAHRNSAGLNLIVRNSDGSTFSDTVSASVGSVGGIGSFLRRDQTVAAWVDRAKGYSYFQNPSTKKISRIRFGNSRSHVMLASGQVIPVGSDGSFSGNSGNNGGGNSGGGNSGGGNSSTPTNPGLQAVCGTVRSIASTEVWKAIASTHIPNTDPRRFSTSFIVRAGSTPPSDNCIEVFDSRGNQVHSLGQYYPTGSAYSARHYGGSGCGDQKRPEAVVSAATSNTGSSEVYLRVSPGSCVRIPNPNSCYNSSQC